MGGGDSAMVEDDGKIRVEPGSCYLAVLAMTGALGTVAVCWAVGLILFPFVLSSQIAGLDKDILSVIGIYLAVHGVAEGWILGFGGFMCFLFWLWLGKIGDAASSFCAAAKQGASRSKHFPTHSRNPLIGASVQNLGGHGFQTRGRG